jgi:hypothetical protein
MLENKFRKRKSLELTFWPEAQHFCSISSPRILQTQLIYDRKSSFE